MPKTALIIGKQSRDRTGLRYQTAFESRGISVRWTSMLDVMKRITHQGRPLVELYKANVSAHLLQDGPISANDVDGFGDIDFAVIVNADQYSSYTAYVSNVLEVAGATLPNSAASTWRACNKWETYLKLCEAGIPTPKSELVSDIETACNAADRMGYPIVVKQLYGAKGAGVEMARDEFELLSKVEALGLDHQPLFMQQYVECAGKDKRAIYINGDFLASMSRHAPEGDFRSNLAVGGRAAKCQLTEAELKLGVQVVEALGLDFAGLDIAAVTKALPGREAFAVNTSFCIEANAMAGLANIARMTGIDGTGSVVEMMISKRGQ